MPKKHPKIKILKNGPYQVSGKVPLVKEIIVIGKKGDSVGWKKGRVYPEKEKYSLCRCGKSRNKPYCDRTHHLVGFEGTEAAGKKRYLDGVEKIEGPELALTDNRKLCAAARFCDRAGGIRKLTKDSKNPESKKTAIQEACDCPSGRLCVRDKRTGKEIEPDFVPSIGIIKDPKEKVGGPIWVRGGIPVESAAGKKYEIRNRVTLCRCGKSENKPFCDGTHVEVGFKDEGND